MVLFQERPSFFFKHALRDDPANFSDVPGFFLAHELAHQWWGQGVAPQNYRERWLAEAWAQYAAALWVRKSRGEGAFRGILDRFAIWAWRHTDAGPIDLGHRLGHLRGDAQIYRAIVYDKGAYVVHMLRAIVGEEAFDKAIRAFLEERRFSKAGTDDLREALEAASGKDLQPYFATWIYGTALPVLRYTAKTEAGGSGYRTVVEVRPRNLPGPVPLQIAVTTEGGRQEQTFSLAPEGGRWTVTTPQLPRKVEINGDRTLLARVERGR
jgi:aminopeptidase N